MIRLARVSLAFFISSTLAELANKKVLLTLSLSIASFTPSSTSGAFCISSKVMGLGKVAMYPIESCSAAPRSIRLSNTRYSRFFSRQSVDFPTCLGPESKTDGEIVSASESKVAADLLYIARS